MSKAARWFRSFLSGKSGKDKEELGEENARYSEKQPQTQPKGEEENNKNAKQQLHRKQQADNSPAPSPPAKESRRRWSFRRSSSTHTFKTKEPASTSTVEAEDERTRRAMAVAAATKAAADAAAAAAQAATVVIRLTEAAKCRFNTVEGTAAVKIQSAFRSYLAKKALKALRGFVKLQALIRGQLVRRIVTAHAADRARRMAMAEEAQKIMMTLSRRGFNGGRSPSPLDPRCRRSRYDLGWNSPEMDLHGTKSKSRTRASPFYNHQSRQQQQISPSPSALTDLSLIASSGRFEESSFRSAESSSMHYYSPMSSAHDSITETMYVISNMCGSCPNYMANTQSSKAKARSQSTPRQRPPTPRRRSSMGSASDGY